MHTVSRTPTGESVIRIYVFVRCPPTWRLATVAKEVGQLIGFVQRVYRVWSMFPAGTYTRGAYKFNINNLYSAILCIYTVKL